MALAMALILVLGGVVWMALPPRKLIYEGRNLDAWLEMYIGSPEGGADELKAERAVRIIGTNALSVYIEWLGKTNSVLKARAIALIRKQSVFHFNIYDDDEHRLMARFGLGILGSETAPAVPALIDLLKNTDDSEAQGEVVMALGRIGPVADAAVPALIQCLNGTNRFAALFVPDTLAAIHTHTELAAPALVQDLTTNNRSIYLTRIIRALGEFGDGAKSAVPPLLPLLNSNDPRVRSAATNALKKIDPETAAKMGM